MFSVLLVLIVGVSNRVKEKFIFKAVLLVVVMSELIYQGWIEYSPKVSAYVEQFAAQGEALSMLTNDADSEELNSILVVSDEAEHINMFHFFLTESWATIHTDAFLIKEDPSLVTLHNFIKGGDYLNSSWTDQLHQTQRLHIIYLAVDPEMQHHGIAAKLLDETIAYAQEHHMMISLETHNEKNVDFYKNFGFQVYGIVEKNFPLKQYCLIREYQ